MGGPAAAILLERPLSPEEFLQVMNDVGCGQTAARAVFHGRRDAGTVCCDQYFLGGIWEWEDGPLAAIMNQFVGQGRRERNLLADVFDLNDEDSQRLIVILEELESYERYVGRGFLQEVVIAADINSHAAHVTLAELAIQISDALPNSLIDLCGVPLVVPDEDKEDWERARVGALSRMRRHEGFCVDVPYETGSDRTWGSLVVDAAFLRRFLHDPNFCMVK